MGCLFLVIQKVKLKEQIVSDGGSTHGFYFIFFVVISILYIFLQWVYTIAIAMQILWV